MSTAAQDDKKSPQPAAGGSFEVARPHGVCAVCGQVIEPDTRFTAALLDTPAGFQRADCQIECWPAYDRSQVIAFWQTVMPRPEAKKKVFVDDQILSELFVRLADATEPARLNFRFVLGLILMRKRLVVYENTRQENGQEIWVMHLKGSEESIDLVNPRLGEPQMKEVSEQLSEILSQEL